MTHIAPYVGCVAAVMALVGCATPPSPPASPPAMSFQIDEGRNINSFVREGAAAAHLLLRSGTDPRILVAFPAGNSGVGLWFAKTAQPVSWQLASSPVPVSGTDDQGRPLHGIEAKVTVDASKLDIHQVVLSSVRVLRD